MTITALTCVVIAACGVGVGILSAMFGIGGGIVMVPLIHIAFGQPAAVASGTSLFAILPTSLAGMAARLHDGTIRFRIGLTIGVVGAVFSPLGAVASANLPGVYAMVLTGAFILYTAYNMFRRWWRSRPQAADTGAAKAERPALVSEERGGVRFWASSAGLGAVVGFLSGYLGLGGGFIIVPVLQAAYGLTMKQSTGTSLVAVGILAVPSFVTHALLGDVAWVIGLLLIVGSVAGTRLGAKILAHVNDRALTGLFGVVLVAAGLIMVFRELAG